MARDRSPVLKRCRSLDLDPVVLGVTKKPSKRGEKNNRKITEYGLQLREKQKVKFIYGVLETQFRNMYDKADNMKGITGENLLILLESRLDNVVFRLGFARTRVEARQIVRHKHVLVNGSRVDIPSYICKAGDKIEIREKSKEMQRYKDIVELSKNRVVPAWLTSDKEKLAGSVIRLASREDIDLPVNETYIVELYSK